jgi:hypothetical protein
MSFKSHPILRAFALLWARLGPARIYLVGGGGVIVLLAALGVVYLFSSGAERSTDPAPSGTSAKQTPLKVLPPPRSDEAVPQDPLLAITEVVPRKKRLRDGSTSVAIKIGIAPRSDTKGDVAIRILFFDVNQDNEMRPTDAQINYNWLTQVRDWTDPAPKYLEATYMRPRTPRGTLERLRYGGFIVRVYLNDQLQDERSDPREILTAMHAERKRNLTASAIPARPPALASNPSPSRSDEPPPAEKAPARTAEAPVAAVPSPRSVMRESASAAPYASPVPGKPGFVYSPHDTKFLIDVRGAPPGTEINDPNTGKPLRVP